MAKRITIGRLTVPIYALSVYALSGTLLLVDAAGLLGRLGVAALVIGIGIQISDKQERTKDDLNDKIDRCVGKVWDAGGRAKQRQMELENAQEAELAVVHTLAPRS